MRLKDRLLQLLDIAPRRKDEGMMQQFYRLARDSIPKINMELGLDYKGEVKFVWSHELSVPAATSGNLVTLRRKWFEDHPEDLGAVVHELTHVVMHCPIYNDANSWLIEGIADYIRNRLGYSTTWSRPSRGNPKSGYQNTAHFLHFVGEKYGQGYIKDLARILSRTGSIPPDMSAKLEEYLAANPSP